MSYYGSGYGGGPMYGSGMFSYPQVPQSAMNYAMSRFAQMPTFGGRSFGAFGRTIAQPSRPMTAPAFGSSMPVTPRGDPGWVFGKGVPPTVTPPNDMRIPPSDGMETAPNPTTGPGGPVATTDAPAIGSPPSAFGFGQPQQTQQTQAIGSPPSAFGFGSMSPIGMPTTGMFGQTYDTRPAPGNDVMLPPQTAQNPPVNPLVAASNANLFSNPWGFSQAQLGPSFNPAGSAQGGYFQGGRYVPNVGNARNGLDTLARFGMGHTGLAY